MVDYSGVYYGGGEYYAKNQTLPLSKKEVAYKKKLVDTVFKGRGRVKICVECGRYFTSDGVPISICSASCKCERMKINARRGDKRYKQKNKEKTKTYRKKYRATHKEEIKKYTLAYREANREIIKQRNLKFRETHYERFREINNRASAKHLKANRVKINEKRRQKYANDRDAEKFFEALAMADAISNYDVDK